MKSRIVVVAALFAASAALAAAADPQLLGMVMPDAQVVAGINVEQAKTTPFGQYVLSQMQAHDPDMQQMATLTGFDPRRDVRELLVASPTATPAQTNGIALARGTFDVAKISAAATSGGAQVSTYKGATVISKKDGKGAFAFPDNSTVVAGTPANVTAALDRRRTTVGSISPALATKVNQLSTTQDAWMVSMVPPVLGSGPGPNIPGMANQQALQNVQQFNGGVKFGSNVVLTAEALAQTAQDAASLAGLLQFIANLAQTQAGNDPTAATLAKSLHVKSEGSTVKVDLTMPYAQFEQLVQPKPHRAVRRVKPV